MRQINKPTNQSDAVEDADSDSLEALYESEYERSVRVASLITGDRSAAEDVVQEAFAALHQRWKLLVDHAAAAGYLRVSVVNGCRTHIRRRQAFARRLSRLREPEPVPPADATLLIGERDRATVRAVRMLPRRQQQVVILRYWYDASEADIATQLGISVGTVKSTSSRALAAMRRSLGET